MCFLLCNQFPAHICGHGDRYVLFCYTFKRTAQKGRQLKKIFSPPPDATLEGSSMGYLALPDGPQPVALPGVLHVSDVKASHQNHSVVARRRRNVLFPSGVKLCAQDTAEQVVAHHLSFFHLRGEAERCCSGWGRGSWCSGGSVKLKIGQKDIICDAP